MSSAELAREFMDLWKDLDVSEINLMLAKNVSVELLELFVAYAEEFADDALGESDLREARARLPNLLVIGYLIRLLEERLT